MRRLCLAVVAATLVLPAHAADKKWSRLDSCRYIQDKNNDGDSFLVRCGKEEFYARFYFIDAPESHAAVSKQVQEQFDYFGVTFEQLTRAGGQAGDYVRKTLSGKPFVIHTKKALAQGRSKNTRYFSLVEIDERYLHQVMISEGHARTKGTTTTLPTGERGKQHVESLRKLESQARLARKGIWAVSDESKRKSPF
jgi:endonuclease YncB( thermonuclease family)